MRLGVFFDLLRYYLFYVLNKLLLYLWIIYMLLACKLSGGRKILYDVCNLRGNFYFLF